MSTLMSRLQSASVFAGIYVDSAGCRWLVRKILATARGGKACLVDMGRRGRLRNVPLWRLGIDLQPAEEAYV